MNISSACSWFGMNMQTQPPLQLRNKEEEDECHKMMSGAEGPTKWQDQRSKKMI
jgi:hypothetical protein